MAAELIIAPEAGEDLAEAYDWYEFRREGLGEDFLTAIDTCLEAIILHPDAYPVVYARFRRALVHRFPYAVFYEGDVGRVIVYCVFHHSRDPHKWRTRLDWS